MILYVRCENFRSIGEKQTISFVANSDKSHSNILKEEEALKILPVIPIYGGNATGKTNILKSIKNLVEIVTGKIKLEEAYDPCKFYKEKMETITEIIFIKNKIKYYYKLSYNNQKIKEEALYYYPKGKISKIFDRKDKDYSFGNSFESSLSPYTQNLSENSCLLNVILSFFGDKIESLNNVSKFFKDDFIFINFDKDLYTIDKVREILKEDKDKSKKIKEFVNYFYKHMNIGVTGILCNFSIKPENTKIFKKMLEDKEFLNKLLSKQKESFNSKFKIDLDKEDLLEIFLSENDNVYLVYETENGNIEIPIEQESEGIKKVFTLGMPIAEALCYNKIVIFDELEVGFHPLLSRKIIELFLSEKNKAQLLFTTHNTNLLDLNLFRRDQIYFASRTKNTSFKTFIKSLGEMQGVRKSADIEKAYLEGKYSNAPTYSDFDKDKIGDLYEK